jgi:hypothetical protein
MFQNSLFDGLLYRFINLGALGNDFADILLQCFSHDIPSLILPR